MIRYTTTHSSVDPDRTTVVASGITALSVDANGPEKRDVALYCTLGDHESLSITFTPEAAERLYRVLSDALEPKRKPIEPSDASDCISSVYGHSWVAADHQVGDWHLKQRICKTCGTLDHIQITRHRTAGEP